MNLSTRRSLSLWTIITSEFRRRQKGRNCLHRSRYLFLDPRGLFDPTGQGRFLTGCAEGRGYPSTSHGSHRSKAGGTSDLGLRLRRGRNLPEVRRRLPWSTCPPSPTLSPSGDTESRSSVPLYWTPSLLSTDGTGSKGGDGPEAPPHSGECNEGLWVPRTVSVVVGVFHGGECRYLCPTSRHEPPFRWGQGEPGVGGRGRSGQSADGRRSIRNHTHVAYNVGGL